MFICDLDFLNWSPVYCETNLSFCKNHLLEDKNWYMLPLINGIQQKCLKGNQLVRFQGMIVDMPDPEYYLSSYEVQNNTDGHRTVKSGRYCEILDIGSEERIVEESPNNVTSERHQLYCITDPTLSPWVVNYLRDQQLIMTPNEDENTETVSKRQKGSNVDACLIKIYEKQSATFSLNDVIEVAGFIGFDSSNDDTNEGTDVRSDIIIHALAVRGLKHCNPLLPPVINTDELFASAEAVRIDLLEILKEFLLGDRLAAEYILCHLISTVYARNTLLTLGSLAVNISGVPQGIQLSSKLNNLLKQLVTKIHLLSMTLENLNAGSLIPKKNYKNDSLTRARLQLSPHTHLILDETALSTGQLNSTGVQNISALGKLISQQKIDYDFQFYQLGFDYNTPVLVLSEGKSLLPCNVEVRLQCSIGTIEEYEAKLDTVFRGIDSAVLDGIRRYLTAARLSEYAIPEGLGEVIENDFVQLRQEHPEVSAEDLHLMLVLARLVSLSCGQKMLTRQAWEKAVDMEKQRKERLIPVRRR
ncbi:mini-chromosome maintenance complex-binding protein-like isoform X2 [Schistocerca gregaria]|uniref:mini-chromosome maintenance complex-binding protein-like isoform X2 n=1 Tax=Schistocerca gregaria TaxID=7010 RepID=UPI00211EFCFB|nr:mini-chromosome maintenance complex-binding protein-like isoform X2 [Schistocerca gregaria]